MTEIGFYHLTRTGVEAALPQLLGRTLAAGERALVLCPDQARAEALDQALWLAPEADWLPHGTAKLGHAALQPIWLTAAIENPNGARYLFLVDGVACPSPVDYARVFDLFDGKDEAAVAAARVRWSAAKAAGHVLAYWKQNERGWSKQ